ncbi:DUF2523 domain-containing protein [Ramlibacter sp.]|uniref:DUF2523 domain-containing protein n=1 Tax=Ramlibacter sp. TaxID=1917967 RepID=UPI0017A853E6|nr:DUF2523 domain-containing protein [Ramlibacter sp.]MBA2675381.1 DUF2523 domain-containing protein [Ramlibacter sp.]
MPALGAILYGAFLWAVRKGLIDVLIGLGIGVATFVGIDAIIDKLKGELLNALSGLPVQMVAVLAYMKVGVALNIIISALVGRLALDGVKNGTFKSWRIK